MLYVTEQEYRRLTGGKARIPSNRKTGPPKPGKYRNVKVYVFEDGFFSREKLEGHGKIIKKFDSVKEYQRSRELRILEKTHRISNVQRQTAFIISPAFTDKSGKKHRAIMYRADFTYEEDGREIVEDVKGYSEEKKKYLCTETFWLKWKLLQSLYPNKVFRLY